MSRPKKIDKSPPAQPLRLEAAAAMLGISKPSLYPLINSGALKVIRFSPRCVRIPLAEVQRLMRGGV
jgi:excisionase family DNA binding protein